MVAAAGKPLPVSLCLYLMNIFIIFFSVLGQFLEKMEENKIILKSFVFICSSDEGVQ